MPQQKCTLKAQAVPAILTEVAEEANAICRFSQRKRQCDGPTFVQTLVLGWLEKPGATLEELTMVAEQLGCQITAQGLDDRLGDKAVMYLAYVSVECMRRLRQGPRLPVKVLNKFTGVYITDSTQFKLPNNLYDEFRGCGTVSAQAKWQITIEYLCGDLVVQLWEEGRQPDQKCRLPVKCAEAGSLQLFDLGYFKQERLAEIDQQKAYFVSRYQSQTALYDAKTGEQIELVRCLQKTSANLVELCCILGRKKLVKVRLIARRLDEETAAERRRKAKQKAKRSGKTCTQAYLQLLGWTILVTNLPATDYSSALIFDFYGLRWQIELLFKTWKSQLKVTHIVNWRPARIFCQLYATLIGAILCQSWTSAYRWWQACEHSITRMIQVIQRHIPDLLRCIARHWRGLTALFKRIEGAFSRHARKEKRKTSPSTLQDLINWGLT